MAVRVVSAVSFHEPLHLITSGWEQESLFAIWKSLQGLAVYADPYEIPFAASVYNWLFYQTFAGVTGSALGLLTLEDAWIPTIARLFTLAGAVAGSAVDLLGREVRLLGRHAGPDRGHGGGLGADRGLVEPGLLVRGAA